MRWWLQWLGVGCWCASVDGVRRMTIAWLGFLCTISRPFHRLHPYTQCRCILSPCQFGLIQGSTSAYHVVAWRCAPQRTGYQGRNGSTGPICLSPCQRGADQKCKPIMWCATRSNTGFQRLRLIGPSSSEDEPLKLMPLAHMKKTALLR